MLMKITNICKIKEEVAWKWKVYVQVHSHVFRLKDGNIAKEQIVHNGTRFNFFFV